MENNVLNRLFMAAGMALLIACCSLAAAAPTVTVSATPSNPIAPANVTLAITATSDGGPVMATQVEYLNGAATLGVARESPFTLTLSNLAAGRYQVSAKVSTTDPNYPVIQSASLAVTVNTATGTVPAYFIHTDQLNTPRAITNANGTLVWQWDGDPFGKDAPNEQPTGQPAFSLNLRFPGQLFDRETNLHYNYFRDYDPALGRYVQSDPIGLNGGINTYGYVEGNPVAKVDPTGEIAIPLTGVVVVGIGAAIWWSSNHPAIPSGQSKSGGIIPPQDFPNGISWPPKDDPKECRIELPPPKLPPPQKPDCETLFQVCRNAVKASAGNAALRIMGDFSCLSAYAICKKVKDH